MTKTTRRKFLQSGLTAALAAKLPAQKPSRASAQKNVLFIAVDDLATQLGCYGHPVHSPNIDRLATRGVRFAAAHCQFPWCSPSRSSLMTGLSPDVTRVYDLTTHFRETLPNVVTLAQLFRQNGYYAARVGKIFHSSNPGGEGTDGLDDPMSWDWTFDPAGVDHYKEEKLLTNFTPKRGLGSAIAFYPSPAKDTEITDGIGATEVIRLLRQPHSHPFFIAYGLYRPHVPWVVPSSYFDLYPTAKMTPYPLSPSELTMAPPCAYWTQPPNLGMSIEQQKQALQGYHAATTFVDAQVGRVLHELENSAHADNTLIVFWSDHGWQLGQHGQWMKEDLFEDATHVPLIFAGAGVPQRGKVCRRTVEHLDLYPTLAEICALENVPSTLHGESLVRLLRNSEEQWSKPAITQLRRLATKNTPQIDGYSIRDERYRYTWWNEGREGEELYDYEVDPGGMKNIAADPAMERTKFRLQVALNTITLSRGRVALPEKASPPEKA